MKQKDIELGGNSASQCTLHVPVVETDPQYLWSETRSPFESEYDNCGSSDQQTHNAPSHSQSQNKSKDQKQAKTIVKPKNRISCNLMLQNIQRDRSSVLSFLLHLPALLLFIVLFWVILPGCFDILIITIIIQWFIEGRAESWAPPAIHS